MAAMVCRAVMYGNTGSSNRIEPSTILNDDSVVTPTFYLQLEPLHMLELLDSSA
jgi:hypothetical protein